MEEYISITLRYNGSKIILYLELAGKDLDTD